jgi:DNA repair protein RecN (Recombination protein N)
MLDAYGGLRHELDAVASLFQEVLALRNEFDDLGTKVKERAYRSDLLQFQVNEIDTASLKAGEKENLEEERNILSNLSRLNELIEKAYSLLYSSDNSCIEQLSSVLSALREMHAIDTGVEETLQMLESAMPLVDDAAIALRGYREKYNIDPDRLEVVDDRLELLRKLGKKYGEDISEIINYRDKAVEELSVIESSDEKLVSIETELMQKQDALLRAAKLLSEKRSKNARKIEALIIANLKDLAFVAPSFKIDICQEKDHDNKYIINSHGMDRVEFLFSANPGEPLKPLARIISGGELSRVMLALKSIPAEVDSLPVLIFDEVDAGIGGRTAESVGKKLRAISEKHQLLCITHLPQIASLGDFHLKIEKKDKDKRVSVDVREIEGKERLDEIARMLSGTSTKTSLKHAEELLGREK